MKGGPSLVLASWLLAACSSGAQRTEAAEPVAPPVAEPIEEVADELGEVSSGESPDEVPPRSELDGAHQAAIVREADDEEEAELIARAERLCPRERSPGLWLSSDVPAEGRAPSSGCRWWRDLGGPGGLRIPRAITSSALAYYSELVEALRGGEEPGPLTEEVDSSQLTYRATSERYETFSYEGQSFREVAVVRLELSWAHFSGLASAFGFSMVRFVVFPDDEEEPPVALGDDEVMVWP